MSITHEEAKAVAREAVAEVFDKLGINLQDHDSLHSFRKDMMYVRSARRASEDFGRSVRTAGIGVVVTALAFAVYWGIKVALAQ